MYNSALLRRAVNEICNSLAKLASTGRRGRQTALTDAALRHKTRSCLRSQKNRHYVRRFFWGEENLHNMQDNEQRAAEYRREQGTAFGAYSGEKDTRIPLWSARLVLCQAYAPRYPSFSKAEINCFLHPLLLPFEVP